MRLFQALQCAILVFLSLIAPGASQAQGTEAGKSKFYYVHRETIQGTKAPFYCYCYSASTAHVIFNRDLMSRFGTWDQAVAARDGYENAPNTCGFCKWSLREGGQSFGQVYVYENCRVTPCQIGVADAAYAVPGNARHGEGWRTLSLGYADHQGAWDYACSLHGAGQYHSPDIAAGVISCGGDDGSRDVTATLVHGTWLWEATCPSGTYTGALSFNVPSVAGDAFSGTHSTIGGGGFMSQGRISGNQLSFVRKVSGRTQYWRGTLSADGQRVDNGVITQDGGHETCTFTLKIHRR